MTCARTSPDLSQALQGMVVALSHGKTAKSLLDMAVSKGSSENVAELVEPTDNSHVSAGLVSGVPSCPTLPVEDGWR